MEQKESAVPVLYYCDGKDWPDLEPYRTCQEVIQTLDHIRRCETCQATCKGYTHVVGWQGEDLFLGCLVLSTRTLIHSLPEYLDYLKTNIKKVEA